MTDESLSAEIELLRKQLDAMKSEREAAVDQLEGTRTGRQASPEEQEHIHCCG